ncbi:MAG: Fic family protein [Rhizomicrobium sp.]
MTRLARRMASQKLPLADSQDNVFGFYEPPMLKAALRDLDMNAGGALSSDVTALSSSDGQKYLTRSLAEEPFSSSLIEGAATTRQIAKKLIFGDRTPRTKDERMVWNNYRALEFVKSRKDDPLTLPVLLELHKLVTQDTLDDPADAGRVRATDDVRVIDDASGEILHQPPAAAQLPDRLERLIRFANESDGASHWIHPMVRAFLLHFLLSYEHPFVDGNGRVARALFYWSALRQGYWLVEYVSISSVIADAEIQYGKAFLDVETDGADTTYFLIYHARILKMALDRLLAFALRKREELAAFEKRLADRRRPDAFNHRQSWLLNEFARGRLAAVTIAEHENRNAVSYLTARSDLEALVAGRLLKKSKRGRTSIYSATGDLVKKLTVR